jgi:hypothetical protein
VTLGVYPPVAVAVGSGSPTRDRRRAEPGAGFGSRSLSTGDGALLDSRGLLPPQDHYPELPRGHPLSNYEEFHARPMPPIGNMRDIR